MSVSADRLYWSTRFPTEAIEAAARAFVRRHLNGAADAHIDRLLSVQIDGVRHVRIDAGDWANHHRCGRATQYSVYASSSNVREGYLSIDSQDGLTGVSIDTQTSEGLEAVFAVLDASLTPEQQEVARTSPRDAAPSRDHLNAAIERQRDSESTCALAEEPTELDDLELLLDRFHRVALHLARGYQGRQGFRIADEHDAQHVLHALLKIRFEDVRAEEWTPSYAGGTARMDFLLKAERVVVEVKMTRRGLGQRELGDQLLQDALRYKKHPDCDILACFIYDPDHLVNNPTALRPDMEDCSTLAPKVIVRIHPSL
jgi:hypothetical protein